MLFLFPNLSVFYICTWACLSLIDIDTINLVAHSPPPPHSILCSLSSFVCVCVCILPDHIFTQSIYMHARARIIQGYLPKSFFPTKEVLSLGREP